MNCKTLFNFTKIIIFSIILCVFAKISNAENVKKEQLNQLKKTNVENKKDNQTQKDKNQNTEDTSNIKDKKKEPSSAWKFVNKWLIPDLNPAFGENGHSIGVQYAYDLKRHLFPKKDGRELHHFAIQYSGPNKFLGIHGRTSLGLGYLYGQDYWALNPEEGKYNTPLFEIIQEFILGNKYVYITCGVGLSWQIYPSANYQWKPEYPYVTYDGGYTADGMTNFNIPLTVAIGHRFDNGLVVELMWKHYSNGHIHHYNHEVNALGISLRYTFGENKKI